MAQVDRGIHGGRSGEDGAGGRRERGRGLDGLVGKEAGVLGAIRDISKQIIEERVPGATGPESSSAADLLSRMLISYTVRSPDQPPEEVAHFLSTAIVAGLTTAPTPAHR